MNIKQFFINLFKSKTVVIDIERRGFREPPTVRVVHAPGEYDFELLDGRIKYLEHELGKAVRYLREGKAKYAPTTTNSEVDDFLEKHSGAN